MSDLQNQEQRLKGLKKFKVNQVAFAKGAIGEVFQANHRETQALYALKRVSKTRAALVSFQLFS